MWDDTEERAVKAEHETERNRWLRRAPVALPATVLAVLLTLVLLLAGCGVGGQTGWQALGPSNSDTIILSLAADPFQSKLIYAGGSTGTVYRARGDTTGAPISNSTGIPKNTSVGALLPNPRKAGTVYAGTSSGIYVTKDYGDHWSALGSGLPQDDTVDALTYGADPTTLFAGTAQHGVYVSHDLGQTWQATNAGLPSASDIYVLLWDPISQTLFAGVDGVGLFASPDGGQTWAARTAGLPDKVEVFALAELPSHSLNPSGPTLFLGGAQGLFASTDGGQTWTPASHGLPPGRVLSLATDPNIPGWIYAGTDTTVYRSPDGGKNWSLVAPGLSHQVSSIVAITNPSTHYVVFAGAGQLMRFPPAPGGSSGIFNTLVTWGFVVVLFLLGYYVLRRTRRQVLASQQSETGTGSDNESAPRDTAPPPTAAMNGHKRPAGTGVSGQSRRPDSRPGGNTGDGHDGNLGRGGQGGTGDEPKH